MSSRSNARPLGGSMGNMIAKSGVGKIDPLAKKTPEFNPENYHTRLIRTNTDCPTSLAESIERIVREGMYDGAIVCLQRAGEPLGVFISSKYAGRIEQALEEEWGKVQKHDFTNCLLSQDKQPEQPVRIQGRSGSLGAFIPLAQIGGLQKDGHLPQKIDGLERSERKHAKNFEAVVAILEDVQKSQQTDSSKNEEHEYSLTDGDVFVARPPQPGDENRDGLYSDLLRQFPHESLTAAFQRSNQIAVRNAQREVICVLEKTQQASSQPLPSPEKANKVVSEPPVKKLPSTPSSAPCMKRAATGEAATISAETAQTVGSQEEIRQACIPLNDRPGIQDDYTRKELNISKKNQEKQSLSLNILSNISVSHLLHKDKQDEIDSKLRTEGGIALFFCAERIGLLVSPQSFECIRSELTEARQEEARKSYFVKNKEHLVKRYEVIKIIDSGQEDRYFISNRGLRQLEEDQRVSFHGSALSIGSERGQAGPAL